MTDKPVDHVLIDARNLLYRSVHVAISDFRFVHSGHDPFVLVLRFISDYLGIFKPKQVHLFWDALGSTVWRKALYPAYKENRDPMHPHYQKVREHIKRQTELCIKILQHLGVRQYFVEEMEADDLIYAFCRLNRNAKIVIISSDKDFVQICYNYPSISLYNPITRVTAEAQLDYDPVIMKALIGDKSDNIVGYHGLGPKRALPLAVDVKERVEFFNTEKACVMEDKEKIVVGSERFKRNLAMVDLSLCPYLIDNMLYVGQTQISPISINIAKVRDLAYKYKLRGVVAEIPRCITPFKRLAEVTNEENTCTSGHPSSIGVHGAT